MVVLLLSYWCPIVFLLFPCVVFLWCFVLLSYRAPVVSYGFAFGCPMTALRLPVVYDGLRIGVLLRSRCCPEVSHGCPIGVL